MKYALILLLGLCLSLSHALDFQPGSGASVWPDQDREYSFAYHNGTDDYHFYGTNTWAVRFDFAAVYPDSYASEFSVTKALLWLPQTGDSVQVALFTDSFGSPGVSLASAQAAVNSNQMEIPFSTAVQGDSLWLVVTYTTSFANRYVSASAGGGSRSYFWNTNATNPYFQSLATAGFNAELLFGLAGNFVLNTPDLELMDFEILGNLQPRQLIGPTFSIYNHSDLTVSDAKVQITVSSPSPEFSRADLIQIPDPIPPKTHYVFSAESPGFEAHRFSLPDQPMQLKLRASLSSSSLGDTLMTGNNTILVHRFSLSDDYPIFMAENFLRTGSSVQITTTQDQYSLPDIHILNYFPILSDSLANVPAQIRFNWYNFNSLPRTVVNGDLRLNGYSATFADQYAQHCLQAQTQKTFVSSSTCEFQHIPQNDMLTANLTLANANTLFYTAATEYNLVNASRLSIGIFKKVYFDGMERYVIDRWITHGASLSGPLGMGQELSANFNISLSNLTLAELAQNYRLYYWLQLSGGGRILYSAYSDFTGVVSVQDEVQAVPVLRVSPNPLRGDGTLRISLAEGQKMGPVQIYNLRGQKVGDFPGLKEELNIPASQFPASGIYLLRVQISLPQGGATTISKKINIIK